MLTRLYVDNYRCLVNCEARFSRLQLLLGPNGSGKSSLFEALRQVRGLLDGAPLAATFPTTCLTQWQTSPLQRVEVGLELDGRAFAYALAIEHDKPRRRARITSETLTCDGAPLFSFEGGEVQLYRDDHSAGPQYPFDWSRSALATISERQDNALLTAFRRDIARTVIVAPAPIVMSEMSSGPVERLDRHMENVVAWYQGASQDQVLPMRVAEALRPALPGFSHFRFAQTGDQWRLEVEFRGRSGGLTVPFGQLSDGERMLCALYMLAAGCADGTTICIDEPANYVGLPEISPWIDLVNDRCDDGELQAVVISHHPLWIDREAASAGLWFDRQPGEPARLARLTDEPGAGMPVSELVERGWIGGA